MNSTPNANRKHITVYGKTNTGKSSLINKILNQEVSLVSDIAGTTTDPVLKAMELIPVGPVVFIDTAGIDDKSELGDLRIKKTLDVLKGTDIALYVMDANNVDRDELEKAKINFKKYNIPYLIIVNKIDKVSEEVLSNLKNEFKNGIFISVLKDIGVEKVKDALIKSLQKEEEDGPILGDLVPYNGTVVLVVPVDSEAPKGRIILPQVQCIRDCLDHGIKSYVVRDTELESALKDLKNVDLVVTDSQAFKKVSKIVSEDTPLTSFSILFARHKGEISDFIKGANAVKNLKEGSKILISESCTHNVSHEDIGRVKIPKLLTKYVGRKLNFEYRVGHDFPDNIKEYDLIIHCGACMINRKTVVNRINYCKEENVPITNYGIILAFLNDILDRSVKCFKDNI